MKQIMYEFILSNINIVQMMHEFYNKIDFFLNEEIY